MNWRAARSSTGHRLTTCPPAPAIAKARRRPRSPSRASTCPSPVSHADSTTMRAPERSSEPTSSAVSRPSSPPESDESREKTRPDRSMGLSVPAGGGARSNARLGRRAAIVSRAGAQER